MKHIATSPDPDRVAHFEAAGWRAYYDRNWARFFWLIAAFSREQLQLPFPLALLAAYIATRAVAAWATMDCSLRNAQAFYAAFCRLSRLWLGLTFDPIRMVILELRHAAPTDDPAGRPGSGELGQTMVDLHSRVLGVAPERASESAEWRVMAKQTLARLANKTSIDPDGDWAKVAEYLRCCYRAIQHEVRGDPPDRPLAAPEPLGI